MVWHAYVDESGDRGWRQRPAGTPLGLQAGSSRTFTMTAVLIPDAAGPSYMQAWSQAAAATGRTDVHWVNVKASGARKLLIAAIAGLPDVQTVSVVLCKWHLPNVTAITDPGYFYHWTARLLVERLSWFGKAHNDKVRLTFAQVRGHSPSLVRSYLKRLGSMPTNIEWGYLSMPPSFSTPKTRKLLQLADAASGAVFGAFEPDPWGYTDQTYINMLKPIMWRPPGRDLWRYGMKVGPWPNKGCAVEHTWLQAFLV